MFSAPAFRASLSAVLLVYPCYGALAEENEDIRIRVGLGGQVRPDYLGSDGTEWAPLWDLAVARGSNQFEFEAPDDNFDIKLYSKDGFSFGPAASIAGGRKRSDVGARVELDRPRSAQSFCVPKSEIATQGYDLSISRYRVLAPARVESRRPHEILAELAGLEAEIFQGMKDLVGMLK